MELGSRCGRMVLRLCWCALAALLSLGLQPASGDVCDPSSRQLEPGVGSSEQVGRLLNCSDGFPARHAKPSVGKLASVAQYDRLMPQIRGTQFQALGLHRVQLAPSLVAPTLRLKVADAIFPQMPSIASIDDVAERVPKGCAIPSGAPPPRAFYVDPIHGEMKNDGSSEAPWRSFEEVVKAGLIATQHYAPPYRPGVAMLPQHPEGVVQAGDVIYLRSGNHGSVDLFGAINKDFIFVEAEGGQKPILANLSLAGASKWVFRGLTIQNTKRNLVEFLNHNFLGPTDNIIFEQNQLWSLPAVDNWTQQDWVSQGADIGIYDQASCSTIKNNQLRNIRRGMILAGDNALVEGNVIDNFGDDAVDILASHITVRGNRITNSHDLGDGNHNDAIQGWTEEGKTNRDTIIDGNTIISSTNPKLPFSGYLQGISVFDGIWDNIRIANNIVVTNAWHGIALFGTRRSLIVNNTVVGIDPAITTWIGVFNMKGETKPASDTVVRNNIASRYSLGIPGIIADHNVTAAAPLNFFALFDVARAQYDLHILPNSPARGAGIPELAPQSDVDGRPRKLPIDAGAYAWQVMQPPR
jgi:parallel beta-helix repeat protein